MTPVKAEPNVQEEVQKQAGNLLTQFAGHIGFKTIQIGLENGLFAVLSKSQQGLDAGALARAAGTDEFYTAVWARAAYAAELLEIDDQSRYSLAAHLDKLLLNEDFPAYLGGVLGVMSQPEMFDHFSENLKSGKRMWWNDASPEFIKAVGQTGRPFYTRLIPAGLDRVPGLTDKLSAGAKVVELGCGAGVGLVKFASAYPNTVLTGLDGDAHSLQLSRQLVEDHGLSDRVDVRQSTLEEFQAQDEYDLAFINISMHECRDIDRVTENVKRLLKTGGHFVISDMPFPATHDGLRTPPARVMTGIQYFEAQIDDQLMPTAAFSDLLERHGFRDVVAIEITPVHNLIHGMK